MNSNPQNMMQQMNNMMQQMQNMQNNMGGMGQMGAGMNPMGGMSNLGSGMAGGPMKSGLSQQSARASTQPYSTTTPAKSMETSATVSPGAPDDNCPFPHIVGVQGLEASVQNSQIQDFFRPVKAIAVNNHGNGYCDVAFKGGRLDPARDPLVMVKFFFLVFHFSPVADTRTSLPRTHKEAEDAMAKKGSVLGSVAVELILKSKPPAPAGWANL